jgi:hypothetical protein
METASAYQARKCALWQQPKKRWATSRMFLLDFPRPPEEAHFEAAHLPTRMLELKVRMIPNLARSCDIHTHTLEAR